MERKPNVVFIFTDDQRFDAFGASGNSEIITPNLDRLVEKGTMFTHAHIPSGTSSAVCMPSRAMLNSGRSLYHIADCGQSIPMEHTTIAEVFRSNGYRTFGTGKWHNGREAYHRGFTDGDEIWFGGWFDHWNAPAFHFDPSGKYASTIPLISRPWESNEVTERPADHITPGKHSTDLIADASIDFIEKSNQEEAFYMYVSFLAPHDPRSMPKKYLDMYEGRKITLPENFTGGHSFDNGELYVRDEKLAPFPRTPENTLRHIKEYYAMITHVDERVGDIIKALEKKGILEDTIIVFSADNGLAVGQHGLFGKQNCYEHSVRVPLVFAGPGIPAKIQTDAYVYLFDIFPTLCELTGMKTPPSVEGKSFAGVIKKTEKEFRDKLYFGYKACQRAVKDRRFKLIEYVVDGRNNMTQLFDLQDDPRETRNLAFNTKHKEKVEELRGDMLKFRDEWDDNLETFGKTFWEGFSSR
ncbi:MAG: hypothetical protein A2017_18610 [Lentisphaerae bacterium GWF2_44_16]|nr:MAG: hypothetical protein A2017_18610 [Lentisphaerae bacterium GWF2_44_16]